MRIDRILAGIDFEVYTEKVLAYVAFFAQGLSASLHLLNVIAYLITPPTYLPRYM